LGLKEMKTIRIICLSTALLLVASCNSVQQKGSDFVTTVFGSEENYSIICTPTVPVIYKLKNIPWNKWFELEDGKLSRVKEYPVAAGPAMISTNEFGKLRKLITSKQSYDYSGDRIFCGFPHWDYMLTYYSANSRLDVCLCSYLGFVLMVKNGRAIAGGRISNIDALKRAISDAAGHNLREE